MFVCKAEADEDAGMAHGPRCRLLLQRSPEAQERTQHDHGQHAVYRSRQVSITFLGAPVPGLFAPSLALDHLSICRTLRARTAKLASP